MENQKIGELGEAEARKYLQKKGYVILHFNWHDSHREIDIITENEKYLIIVEVKTRTDPEIENPKEAVTIKKQKKIIMAADNYVNLFDIDKEVRFDVISVLIQGEKIDIEHIEDAFTPMW